MGTVTKCFFDLLRSEIDESFKPNIEKTFFTDDVIRRLYALAANHDLAHLIADALYRLGFIGADHPYYAALQKQQMTAVLRTSQQDYELNAIRGALENERIRFLPLKGSILRGLYPQSWMRTSCDIDILIHREDMEKAADSLVRRLSYRLDGKTKHDWLLSSPNGTHLELHFSLVEHGRAAGADAVLKNVWEYAESDEGGCCFRMSDEMFYFYHIAHMAKHFESGGCGIRSFLDLRLLNRQSGEDTEKRKQLLENGGLLRFEQYAVALSDVWFGGSDHSDTTARFEDYVIRGGVYGSTENRVALQQKKKKGKFGYLMYRIFRPYAELKLSYPVLEKHKWLFPFMQIRRWFGALSVFGTKRMAREIRANASVTEAEAESAAQFLNELGLL